MSITIRDLKSINGSFDVYGNIADEIGICFENNGTEFLTEYGINYFNDILDIEVEIRNDIILILTDKIKIINIDLFEFDDYDSYPSIIRKIYDLFWFYSGYVDDVLYNKLFIVK